MNKIKILYHDKELPKIEQIEKGNWIDLRVSKIKYQVGNKWKTFDFSKGDAFKYAANSFMMFDLGVSIDLNGNEAHIVPRSSTFKNYGLIQTNHMGVVDSSYCGEDDIWHWPCFSLRKGEIKKGDRICQFRIMEPMKDVDIIEVEHLSGENRGGFGSTGKE